MFCGEITNESIVNARGSYGVALAIDSSEDKCESRKTMVQNQLKFSKDSQTARSSIKNLKQHVTNVTPEAFSEPNETSSLELFVKIVNGWKPLEWG